MKCIVVYEQRECIMWKIVIISSYISSRRCFYLLQLHMSTLESKDQTTNRGRRWSNRGGGVKRQENMIHGRAGSSRETAADLQSKGHWTGTKALFRQSECSVSCDGWRRSV